MPNVLHLGDRVAVNYYSMHLGQVQYTGTVAGFGEKGDRVEVRPDDLEVGLGTPWNPTADFSCVERA